MFSNHEDFQRQYNLSEEDVKETLKACGISVEKPSYSQADNTSFALARKLLDDGLANSYDDIANHFKNLQSNGKEKSNNFENNPEVQERLKSLEQQAIQRGLSIGIQHAEIMGKVIPKATIMRLKQMIETGEMRDNFDQLWQQATSSSLGKDDEYLTLELERQWNQYQLQKSQPPLNLLESSTESSNRDF